MAKMHFYFDEMMPRPVANELIKRGFEVTMATDVQMRGQVDPKHLEYASGNGMVLVTCDRAFAGQSVRHRDHMVVICWLGQLNDFGGQVRVLTTFADQHTPEQVAGHVFWLKP